MCLLRGKSTPDIRAKSLLLSLNLVIQEMGIKSTLSLLVLFVDTTDSDDTFALQYLALTAYFFYR